MHGIPAQKLVVPTNAASEATVSVLTARHHGEREVAGPTGILNKVHVEIQTSSNNASRSVDRARVTRDHHQLPSTLYTLPRLLTNPTRTEIRSNETAYLKSSYYMAVATQKPFPLAKAGLTRETSYVYTPPSHRLLFRGSLSVPGSRLLLEGLTFTVSLKSSPAKLLENPLALALESMRGRTLALSGITRLDAVHLDRSTEVNLCVITPLSLAYITLTCAGTFIQRHLSRVSTSRTSSAQSPSRLMTDVRTSECVYQ